MANPGMRHGYKSLKADPADTTIIGATKWNDRHYFLEDDGSTASGALGDLPYRGTAGLVTLLTGAQGVLASAGSGNVPAWTMSPTLTGLTVTTITGPSNTVEQRNGTSAQILRVYDTWANAGVDYERGVFAFAGSTLQIGTEQGGTGVAQSVSIRIANTNVWQFTTSGHVIALTDNTYDIGASGASRPRNIFAGGGITTGSTTLHTTSVALTNGAGAGAGTITNAPAAGNPTKWVPINDNGTTRYIPAW